MGVAIHGRARKCCLCSTFEPVFTGGLFLDVSDRTNEALVVEVMFLILPSKCVVLREFSHSTVYRCTTRISQVDIDIYSRVASGNPANRLSHCTIR